MNCSKTCAIQGPAGGEELAGLISFAIDGWNIAFMDPDKKAGEYIKQELEVKYNVKVLITNTKDKNDESEYDIEAFIYHGSWDDEEDVDIFWAFINYRYGEINHVINSNASF